LQQGSRGTLVETPKSRAIRSVTLSMDSPDRILNKPIGARFAPPTRGGNAGSGDFRAALARADGAAGSVEGGPFGGGRSKHVVKAGETLYGIANARLAAAGQPATPGAAMRYALQIAKDNQIRNPDRILAGQQLDIAPAVATVNSRNDASIASARGATVSDGAGIHALHGLERLHRWADTHAQADAGGSDWHADVQPPNPALPAAGRVAADEDILTLPENAVAARVDLGIYQQIGSTVAAVPTGEVSDIVYKGMVGKALDLVPLEPATRTGLQQVSTVVSSSFAGRSLAALTGLGGPLLTLAGLVWGLFSAHKIGNAQPEVPQQVAQNASTEIVR